MHWFFSNARWVVGLCLLVSPLLLHPHNLLATERIAPPAEAWRGGVVQTVTGTVTDAESGDSLPGVNVVVKNTTIGTSTGNDGQFELDVTSLQDTLVFSFVGYRTEEVPLQGRTQIDVALQPEALVGEGVVVTALNIERTEESVGYATQ